MLIKFISICRSGYLILSKKKMFSVHKAIGRNIYGIPINDIFDCSKIMFLTK